MMMSARGLPIELLDDEELKERFKQIDAAIERVKQDIEKAVADQRRPRARVKLTDQQHHTGAR